MLSEDCGHMTTACDTSTACLQAVLECQTSIAAGLLSLHNCSCNMNTTEWWRCLLADIMLKQPRGSAHSCKPFHNVGANAQS